MNERLVAMHKKWNFCLISDDISLQLIPESSRRIFFWIILVISVVTLPGNIFAILSTTKRKKKCLQKLCIISLALADVFSVVMFATNNLDALSRELKIWKLGEFMCYFIPMAQVLGTTASSFALLGIALDRYQNVSLAIISRKWNPTLWTSILVMIIAWIVSAGTAYPMYVFFTYNPVTIIYTNGTEPLYENAYMCVAIDKDGLMLYYILMSLFIFLPIILVFVWFYYQIAALVWKHRKPFTMKYNRKYNNTSTESTEVRKIDSGETSVGSIKIVPKKPKNVQMEKKLRTFKVVIVLMMAFTLCRLPYWVYFVLKLIKTIPGSTMWNTHFTLTSLNMLNCALNPFLYTFLNETISATKRINEVVCKMVLCCCCFCSSEFEDFEKNNPFEMDCEQKKDTADDNKNSKNTRVKFIDVNTVEGRQPIKTN